METTILTWLIVLVVYYLCRIFTVYGRRQEFNYFVSQYIRDNMYVPDKSFYSRALFQRNNHVYSSELFRIIINPFKLNPDKFFKYKPGYKQIYETYMNPKENKTSIA